MESSCKSQELDPAPVTKRKPKLANLKLLSLTYYRVDDFATISNFAHIDVIVGKFQTYDLSA